MCVSDAATHIVLRGEVNLLLLVLQFVAASSVRPSRALSPSRTPAESLPVFFKNLVSSSRLLFLPWKLKYVWLCFWGSLNPVCLSMQRWYVGMLASCSSGVLLLVLSTIQSCHCCTDWVPESIFFSACNIKNVCANAITRDALSSCALQPKPCGSQLMWPLS